MAPARLFSTPASAAYLRRFVSIVVASIVFLLLAGTALASIGTPRPIMSTQQLGMSGVEPGALPDVTLLVGGTGADIATEIGDDLLPALAELDGIHSVSAEAAANGRHAVYVSIGDDADGELLSSVTATVAEVMPDTPVLVGGRAVADRDLLDRLNRSLLVAVAPVMILLAVLVTVSIGGRYGLAVSASVALSTLVSGLLGAQSVGRFDGSIATTGVPAVLAGVLVSSVLSFRLLEWFKHPQGEDQAASIRAAIRALLPELGLLIGGLVGAAFLLELTGASRTPAVGVAAGAVVAAIVTFAVLPSMLATLPQVPDEDDYRLFQLHLPDGRDVPTPILAGFGVFLLCLGAFATRLPSGELLDESALPAGVTSRSVAETVRSTGGDPTSALLATISASSNSASSNSASSDSASSNSASSNSAPQVRTEQVAAWARAVSAIPSVGWVESASGRYVDGSLVVSVRADRFVQANEYLAVVTPSVAARSAGARELADVVAGVEVSGLAVDLSGVPVDAAASSETGRGLLILLAIALAVGGAVAAFVLVRSVRSALIVAGMRLLGIGGALGVYGVVVGDATMGELQLVMLVISLGIGLFELGVLRRLAAQTGSIAEVIASAPQALESAEQSGFTHEDIENERMTDAIRTEGRAAVIGMSIVAVCGIGLLASDLEVARRLGIGLAAVMIVELLIGTWLLRPALLGERLFYVSFLDADAASPRVSAITTGAPSSGLSLSNGAAGGASATMPASGTVLFDQAAHETTDPADGAGITTVGGPEVFESLRSIGSRHSESPDVARPLMDPQWRRIVQGLLRAEFSFQNDPANAELSTVFVEDTPVFSELIEHNRALRANGFRVVGRGPRLVKVQAVDDSSPVTVAITVDHPERRLLDRDGRLLGVRRPERREGMLWLAQDPSGRYRIAEAVDLGTATDPISAELPAANPSVALTI